MNNYMNIEQLAKYLPRRSRASIYGDVKAGRLPQPRKLGRRVFWLRSEVDEAMEAAPRANIGSSFCAAQTPAR